MKRIIAVALTLALTPALADPAFDHSDPKAVSCTGAETLANVQNVIADSPAGVQGVKVIFLRDANAVEFSRTKDSLTCLIDAQTNAGREWDGWWFATFHNDEGRSMLNLKHFTDAQMAKMMAEAKRQLKREGKTK